MIFYLKFVRKIQIEKNNFGQVDIIYECESFGVYLLKIAPLGKIQTHVHRKMREWEIPLSEGLKIQGRAARLDQAFAWPKEFAHQWENASKSSGIVLCVDSPRFDVADEVYVDEELLSPPAGAHFEFLLPAQ